MTDEGVHFRDLQPTDRVNRFMILIGARLRIDKGRGRRETVQ